MDTIAPAAESAALLHATINGRPVTIEPQETILQCQMLTR